MTPAATLTARRTQELTTARLRLRTWRGADWAAMAAINRDPEVTRYVNRPPAADAIDEAFFAMTAHWHEHGFGPWAVELRRGPEAGRLIGFVGPSYPTFVTGLAHCPELGWRLARDTWGQGLATEAAVAARDDLLERLGVPALIAIIHPNNARSIAVARKLGMARAERRRNLVTGQDVDVWSTKATTR